MSNIEENKENVEELNAVKEAEERKDIIEEVEVVVDEKVVETIDEVDKKPSLGKRIFAGFLDQAIIFGISAITIVIFSLFIGLFGYEIVSGMAIVILFIAYIVLNILYVPVLEANGGKTIGKRILAIA